MSKNRNQPCACGSGRKFKKCCWTPRAWPEEKAPTKEEFEAIQKIMDEAEQAARRPFRRAPMSAMMLLATAALIGCPYRK